MIWGGKRLTGTLAHIFFFASIPTHCPGLDPVFPGCPHARSLHEKHQRPQHTADNLFVLNALKTLLENNLSPDPDFQCHYGAFKAHFILGCQSLSAHSKQHLEIHANSWINTICSLETCLHLSHETSLPLSPRLCGLAAPVFGWPEVGLQNPKPMAPTMVLVLRFSLFRGQCSW